MLHKKSKLSLEIFLSQCRLPPLNVFEKSSILTNNKIMSIFITLMKPGSYLASAITSTRARNTTLAPAYRKV